MEAPLSVKKSVPKDFLHPKFFLVLPRGKTTKIWTKNLGYDSQTSFFPTQIGTQRNLYPKFFLALCSLKKIYRKKLGVRAFAQENAQKITINPEVCPARLAAQAAV